MKNMYGTFPDIDKAKYHKKSIEDTILEVNSAFTPNLVIIDGCIGGEAVGPLSACPVYFEMMGYEPMDIVHIKKAYEARSWRCFGQV